MYDDGSVGRGLPVVLAVLAAARVAAVLVAPGLEVEPPLDDAPAPDPVDLGAAAPADPLAAPDAGRVLAVDGFVSDAAGFAAPVLVADVAGLVVAGAAAFDGVLAPVEAFVAVEPDVGFEVLAGAFVEAAAELVVGLVVAGFAAAVAGLFVPPALFAALAFLMLSARMLSALAFAAFCAAVCANDGTALKARRATVRMAVSHMLTLRRMGLTGFDVLVL